VFGDPLALTYLNPDHSADEERFITVGISSPRRLRLAAHSDRNECVRILAPAKRRGASGHNMSKRTEKQKQPDELRREYDLSELKVVFAENTRRAMPPAQTQCFYRRMWPNIFPMTGLSIQLCAG
jgi:hypothetical protein